MSSGNPVLENAAKSQETLMRECRGILNLKVARKVVREQVLRRKKGGSNTLGEFLGLFHTDLDRTDFLAFYVEELKQTIIGKANCGPVHHAEDGVPCEHDWAKAILDAGTA